MWINKSRLPHGRGAIDNQLDECETNHSFQISLGFYMQTENLAAKQSIGRDRVVIICSGRQGRLESRRDAKEDQPAEICLCISEVTLRLFRLLSCCNADY